VSDPGDRRIRIGIDTGGTFTDVVAVDEVTGELAVTKTPSTPADPALGFMTGVHKVLDALGLDGSTVSAVSHGTTVATNKLLEGKVGNLGFITTEGYEFLLEIARQSVPDGYGNSYFWVKPDRIVPVHRVRTVGGRLAVDGSEIRPFDEQGAVAVARWFRDQGIDTLGVCFIHSYVDDSHERAMREVLRREHPEATVSISSEVLREYREYERAVTTLVDAAVKPDIRSYVANIAGHLARLPAGAPAGLPDGTAAPKPSGGATRRLPPHPSTDAAAPSVRPSGSGASSASRAAMFAT
jgi:N-methylhydantoinase A